MSGGHRRSGVAAAGMLLLALGGCGGEERAAGRPAVATRAAAPEVAEDPGVASARREMPGAVTVGSAAAPIDLRYEIKSAPIRGRPFDIEFAVLPEATIIALRGRFDAAAEGIEIAAPADGVALEKLPAGSVQRFTATAVPHALGAHVLVVQMDVELPTGPARRTFSIPLVVQARAPATATAGGGAG